MCRLIESIKVFEKKLFNIEYHNKRMNNSRRILFNCNDEIDLSTMIKIPDYLTNGLYKCRLIYSKKIESIEFIPYVQKVINKIKVVENDSINYEHKYEDRTELNKMLSESNADEIIIIKNNFVTDASFANLIFSDGIIFITPSTPLLKGTKREKLLNEGIIREEEIKKSDIKKFKYVYLINSMLNLEEKYKISLEKILM
ncbi:MAG: aminotransferase class IV [Melioribacteraceae bacterium]